MERINLAKREKNPLYHDKSQDIETALAWNAVKQVLTEEGKISLFGYIQSVKVTEKYITIHTKKPLINEEFGFYKMKILARYEIVSQAFSKTHAAKKIRFI